MKKKNKIQPIEIDGMLYQKTNEDFNKEKLDPLDPVQKKDNPIQQEQKIKLFEKACKK
ncbi:hypothetical protein [Flavobacterium sp.]|uniref:hypothetical protein n=1 Tax=Flavobacterium sp. TaxID=239 RepID=UPI00374C916D